ncbi:MAG: beta-ketoacyl synthase [uncultured bacterium]|nr:MAG: beta-ketoacyl synthase [uncultured bacterium]
MILNSKGHYFGSYRIVTKKYSGEDFSRKCFIFPGQGSAYPGMFKDQYASTNSIQEKFREADSLAKMKGLQKISDYILYPEKIEKEKLPIIRNLALFTMEVALFEVLISKRNIPEIITAHSFGEYAGLVASGIISFEEMFEIVYFRDSSCPIENSLGFMIAVGASEDEINAVLANEKFYISNLNSYEQTVISAEPGAIKDIEKILKENNIKYKILSDVPQPYHCLLLNDVKNKIEKYIEERKINLNKPQIPIFSSVIYKLIDKENFQEDDIKKILVNQIVFPVNFIFQISSIYELRCFNFIELNEKKLFSLFVRNILAEKEIKIDHIANILKIEKKENTKYISSENSKLFSLISKVIGEITGYEIEKISLEDRYQEDLGIDSIKKADILLTVLNESKINPGEGFNTSRFGSIADTINYLNSAEKENHVKSKQKKKTFFDRYVFTWQQEALDENFLTTEGGGESVVFELDDIYSDKEMILKKMTQLLERKDKIINIIIKAKDEEYQQNKIITFFNFWNALLKTAKPGKFNLVLLSFGNQCVCTDGYVSFFKSMKKELPDMFFKNIRFEKETTEKEIMNIVQKELRDPFSVDVLYREGKRFISKRKKADSLESQYEINKNSVILAIGGAKGITFSLIWNISRKYKPVIFLVGKSLENDSVVLENIKKLKEKNPEIYYESLDARDVDSLEKIFLKIKNKHKKIDIVINGAGVVNIGFIAEKSEKDAEHELSTKVAPAINVLELASKYDVKKVINFSSIISKYGSAGQSIYTLANEIVTGLTLKHPVGSIVHWPPWDGVGMTKHQGILKNLNEHGVSLLTPKKADELFACDLTSGNSNSIYYMDKDDDSLYGFSLNNFNAWHPLIGKLAQPLSLSQQNQVFEKSFDLANDTYLEDHKIDGTSYVPAAVSLAMFFCLAKMQNKGIPILENFVIHNPMIVKENSLKCKLMVEKKSDGYDFFINSNITNSSCQTKQNIFQEKKKKIDKLEKAFGEILVNSIYGEYYSQKSLYLGPVFQNIDKVFLDQYEKPFLRIDNSKMLPVLNLGFYDKFVQWVDVAFQALGATGLKNNKTYIPVRVAKISTFFENDISNILFVIPSVIKIDSVDIIGDVLIVNEDGEVLIELTGISMKSITSHVENKLKIVRYEKIDKI